MILTIFDIDGTLTDTNEIDEICFTGAFEKIFGFRIGKEHWDLLKSRTGWTDSGASRIIIEEFLNKEYETGIVSVKQCFHKLLISNFYNSPGSFQEIPGAKHIFNYIKELPEIKIAIATGSWAQSGKIKLEAAGFNYRDIPYTNADLFETRNEIVSEAIRLASLQYKCDFKEIFYIGDAVWDLATAEKLGLKFIGIDLHDKKMLENAGADVVINNYRDTEFFMKCINSDNLRKP